MEKEPTKHRLPQHGLDEDELQSQSIRFLLNVINSTIFSSGDDYEGSVAEFFPQVHALGSLIGARNIEEVSEFMRRRSLWQ